MKARFYWDFFGPRAQGTAEHFERHLRQFLGTHSLALPTGMTQAPGGQVSIFCDVPDLPRGIEETTGGEVGGSESETIADRMGRALRPNRVERIIP